MNKFYHSLRLSVALIIGLLSVLAFIGEFYPIKIFDVQLTALLQRLVVHQTLFVLFLFSLILVLTVIFGRIYCSTLCPLGLLQEFLMFLFKRKNKYQISYSYKYFVAAIVFGALLGGSSVFIRLIDPYTIFGSAITGMLLGGGFVVILASIVWFKGRFFCTNICPVGALLGLISKISFFKMYIEKNNCISCSLCAHKCPTGSIDFKNKTINNETCIRCFKCIGGCKRSGIHYGLPPKPQIPFDPFRRRLLISGAVIATFALAFNQGIKMSKKVGSKLKKAILPAGADNEIDFANRCLNCNLCVQNCPMKVIKKANADYSTVHLDYSESFCDFDCHKCSEVCPSGAIKRMSLAQKQKLQIGLAEIDTDKCIKCGLCVMKCPKEAITKENESFPKIDENCCIGCGTCQNTCPVQAIRVLAVEKQKFIKEK